MTNVIVKNAFKDFFKILIPLFRSTNFVKPKPRARTISWIAELPNLEHCCTLHCQTVCELFADFYYYNKNYLQREKNYS